MDNNEAERIPYRPRLGGNYLKRFTEIAEKLSNPHLSPDEANEIALREYDWATNIATVNPQQRRIYRAVVLLLRDLRRVGWSIHVSNGQVSLGMPVPSPSKGLSQQDLVEEKARLRQLMSEARLEKLREAERFIRRMEHPPSGAVASRPVTDLIGSSQVLNERLKLCALEPDPEKAMLRLQEAVQPYLVLVKEGDRCPYTGHLLSDIWRYFRFFWSTPAESTPGRTLLYLIRDASQDLHPIMGLLSFENAAIKIRIRDDEFGWTAESFARSLLEEVASTDPSVKSQRARDEFTHLLQVIERSISEIQLDGLITNDEVAEPTDDTIARLKRASRKTEEERDAALLAWHSGGNKQAPELRSDLGSISVDAEQALYRRKRLDALVRLLSAKRLIAQLLESPDFDVEYESFLTSEPGISAIRSSLASMKSRHIGTSLLELNVCGAIPPYNYILGGKLAALMALSPQVGEDYQNRYGNRPSDIASRLKGEPVIRPANLVYISTTSLYQVGSSQYERLRIPENVLGEGASEVRWRKLGKTTGFGTFHISALTSACIEEAGRTQGFLEVNHVFGEGSSPKLRLLRDACSELFEPGSRRVADAVLRHSMSRIVYGAWLATNGRQVLRDQESSPRPVYGVLSSSAAGTEAVAEFWRRRWLKRRIMRDATWEELQGFDANAVIVSNHLAPVAGSNYVPIEEVAMPNSSDDSANQGRHEKERQFLRDLYRGLGAYADGTPVPLLHAIHIETPLEKEVLRHVAAGRSVVLTGNPGDGKTHLLRKLAYDIREANPEVQFQLDASTVADEELGRWWEDNIRAGKPICLAINEAVLYSLKRCFAHVPMIQEAWRQVETAIQYGRDNTDEDSDPELVAVFDLSRRNVLDKEIVASVIDKLTADDFAPPCSMCQVDACDYANTRRLLSKDSGGSIIVRSRLQQVLDRVAGRGFHATQRELLSYVSFLLHGDRDCFQLIQSSNDPTQAFPNLAYSAMGSLADAIRATFDPGRVTHPTWDERLIDGEIDHQAWCQNARGLPSGVSTDRLDQIELLRRSFYFLHPDGQAYLEMADSDERDFVELLSKEPGRPETRKVVSLIHSFFNSTSHTDSLPVWQSHRYNQSARKVLLSIGQPASHRDFELLRPRLRESMSANGAIPYAPDHLLLRHRRHKTARLAIDYELYATLARAERGEPMRSLETDQTRRLWHFMEQLYAASAPDGSDFEADVQILDLETGELGRITVDIERRQFQSLEFDSVR